MTRPLSKKEMILEIAGEAFSRNGYDRTTLDEIAKRCEITKPAIYYHFKDKFTLYEAILCSRFEALGRRIAEEVPIDDPRRGIEIYIRIFGGFLSEDPGFSAILARELAEGARELPENCIRRLAGILDQLTKILREGEKQGVFGAENPFMIQMMIVSTLINYQTTADLRAKVQSLMGDTSTACPRLGDILPNLTQKILRALTC